MSLQRSDKAPQRNTSHVGSSRWPWNLTPGPQCLIVPLMSLAEKLHPDRFSAMSGRMAAIVGHVIGEDWTEPRIGWLSVSSDGYISTEDTLIGEAADLDRNILSLLSTAGLTPEERDEFEALYRQNVDDWRPVIDGPTPAGSIGDRLVRPSYGA